MTTAVRVIKLAQLGILSAGLALGVACTSTPPQGAAAPAPRQATAAQAPARADAIAPAPVPTSARQVDKRHRYWCEEARRVALPPVSKERYLAELGC
jgi:hypothetical protein